MSQMAPISWLFLFTIFSVTFILFNIMNYFIFFYSSSMKNLMSNTSKTQNSFNWKW